MAKHKRPKTPRAGAYIKGGWHRRTCYSRLWPPGKAKLHYWVDDPHGHLASYQGGGCGQ